MGKRDNLYTLKDMIEFDEGYFEQATSERIELKRGRGSQRQKNIDVMAGSTPLTKENGISYPILDTLKWVRIAISNAKRTLLSVYPKIKSKYLQAIFR